MPILNLAAIHPDVAVKPLDLVIAADRLIGELELCAPTALQGCLIAAIRSNLKALNYQFSD